MDKIIGKGEKIARKKRIGKHETAITAELTRIEVVLRGSKIKWARKAYHRAEMTFDSIEALSDQISRDVASANDFFNSIEQLEAEKRLSDEK